MRDRPLLTDIYESFDSFVPDSSSVYVFARSGEERSAHPPGWEMKANDVSFIRIAEQRSDFFAFGPPTVSEVSLRSSNALREFWAAQKKSVGYIDITGLSHHVWAPLLRSALEVLSRVMVVYVEPIDYAFSSNPTEGVIFDLSERIEGIRPIPGFTVLRDTDDDETCFIPLLGFEGPRFAFLLEQMQPPGDRIIPIVGVPGFRPEFPFHTYQGNRTVLESSPAWRAIRFAIANDPFSLYYTLTDIASSFPGSSLKIAPIGTKPHALGAVLYALARPSEVELVYDYPIRKANRTAGRARVLVYHASLFLSRRAAA